MKTSLVAVKMILIIMITVSIGSILGAIRYVASIKNNPPIATQPTPTITQILTPIATVTSTPIPVVTPNTDTSDWKTYKNEKYGYEIKYPFEWQGGEESPVAKVASFTPEKRDMAQAGFWVYLYENPENLSPKDWWVKDYKKGNAKYTYKGIIRFSEIDMDVYKEESGLEFQYYISSKNSNIYLIASPLGEEKMNQILSTFKFTEIDNTADWKTYRNEKYGFEIKYPTQWTYNAVLENQIEFREKGKTYEIEGSDIYTVGIFIYDNTDNQTIKQMYETIKDNGGDTDKIKNLVIGNMDAIQIVDYLQENTIILKNNKIYNIATPEFGSQEIDKNVRSVYDKMLPTFNFIEK